MNKPPKTAIIIVNWDGEHLLQECLSSLFSQTRLDFEVVLVDNGSGDGSVSFVRKKFPQVKIVELKENTGFSKGNNIGISVALQNKNIENIILLNNDTKVEKDFLEKLLEELDRQQTKDILKIGALTPKMLLGFGEQNIISNKAKYNNTSLNINNNQAIIDSVGTSMGRDGRSYNIGHGEIDKGQYNKTKEVFGFCGGAVLLRREMLEDIIGKKMSNNKYQITNAKNWQSKLKTEHRIVGAKDQTGSEKNKMIRYQEYFDDNFFAYYEDADLSWRMQWRGWKIITAPKAVVWHLHSATADKINQQKKAEKPGVSAFKAYYLNRNRFLMMLKNFPNKMLWRGLWLVPKSYFNNNSVDRNSESSKKQGYSQGDKNSFSAGNKKDNEQNKYTLIGGSIFNQKIKNIWRKKRMVVVLAKVAGSLIVNLPRVTKQRKIIRKSRLTKKVGKIEKIMEQF